MQGRIESIGGREKDPDDYEKIRQWLGELLVVHHFVSYAWPGPVTFDPEPVAAGSQQNPEMTINAEGSRLGIEVGTPDLRELVEQRGSVDRQLLNRMPGLKDAVSGEVPTAPRQPDQGLLVQRRQHVRRLPGRGCCVPIRAGHRLGRLRRRAISALLSPSSGLLTPNSFDELPDGSRRAYPDVDAVVLLRPEHRFVQGLANRAPCVDRDSFLDYGRPGASPFNSLIGCPDGEPLDEELLKAMHAIPPHLTLGAEYVPAESVMGV